MTINSSSSSRHPRPVPSPQAGEKREEAGKALLRLLRDQRGVTAVLVALTVPVLLLFGGLAIDTGAWFTTKRQIQSAADAAALSAAYEVIAGIANLVPAATEAAGQNYYTGYAPTATCAGGGPLVCYPYSDSLMTALNATGVEVILNQPINPTLASWALPGVVTIATKAVAIVNTLPPGCMLALNPTANDAINLAGNPSINAPTCTLVSDSDSASAFHLQGSASITAATLITPGGLSHTGAAYTLTLSYPPQIGANSVPDPYAGTLTHANFLADGLATAAAGAPCSSSVVNGVLTYANGSYNPGCVIPGGLAIKNSTVNLSPGTYWLTGDLDLQNGSGATLECTTCSNGGAGVTLILTAPLGGGTVGTVTLDSNADLDLNAPDTGPFAGMVLIQDSNGLPAGDQSPNPDNFNAQANATETLSGLVYFPDAAVTFQGTPAATGPQCLVLVANTVAMQGNPGFATNGCSSLGLNTLPIIKTVALAE
jgi:Flp pilus assembly protein TadG